MNRYEVITDRIITLLKQGCVPWSRPWTKADAPKNLVSKKEYRGINVFLLAAESYGSPWWMSFGQAKALGGHVRQGEHGIPVVSWKWCETGSQAPAPEEAESEGEITGRARPFLRYHTVFNLEQVWLPGQVLEEIPAPPRPAFRPIEACGRIVLEIPQPPKIRYGEARAYYLPTEDLINLPRPEMFRIVEEHYSTFFHELVHASGHSKRLNRPTLADLCPFGSTNYSCEELIAEMGVTFLCAEAEIENQTIDNSASYIEGWLKHLKGDARLVVLAAAQAQRAVNYILDRKCETEGEASQSLPCTRSRERAGESAQPITGFQGTFAFLSNFFPALVALDGKNYPTVEHAFQAAKTVREEEREAIRRAPTPGQAKRLGRKVALRPDWDAVRVDVMLDLLRQKFSDPTLCQRLMATGDALLIEGNTWGDRFWGCVMEEEKWVGENTLGRLLMHVRAETRAPK